MGVNAAAGLGGRGKTLLRFGGGIWVAVMSDPVIRIFSDLHYGDARSRLRDLAALRPLLHGADEVVLNGDTVDTLIPGRSSGWGEVVDFFAKAGPRPTYLTGNHDPDLEAPAELALAGGRVWVTHGDVFYEAIAPWSHHAAELRRRLAALRADVTPMEWARVETRLRLNRAACVALPGLLDVSRRSAAARVARLVRTVLPPTRLLEMAKSWRETPARVGAVAGAERPLARVVVLGHTHYPGVWAAPEARGLRVVNTGSFARPFGGIFVELVGERVRVVRIVEAGGQFRPGRVVAEWGLEK